VAVSESEESKGSVGSDAATEAITEIDTRSGEENTHREVVGATRRWRAEFAALLMFAMAVPTFLQVAVAVLAPFLRDEFELSAAHIGILGTALFLPAALAAPVVGHLVDVVGARRIAVVLFMGAGVSIGGFAVAQGFPWMVAMAATNGLAQSGSNPVTNRLIAAHIPFGRRGLILGIKQSGVKVSQFLAGALVPIVAVALGWRWALVIAAGVALLGVPAVFMVLPRTRTDRTGRSRPTRRPGGRSTLVRLATYAFLMATGQSALYLYLPLYSHDELGISVGAAGLTLGFIGLVAIFARIAWGPIAERFSLAAVPLTLLAIGSVGSQVAIMSATETRIAPLWFGVVGISLTAAVWNTAANYAVITRFDKTQTGWASGTVQSAFLLGLSTGPFLAGSFIEATESYHVAWLGVCVVFGLAAAVSLQWWISERGTSVATSKDKYLAYQRTP
jgi:predicted MFS family arabinose efflux permease